MPAQDGLEVAFEAIQPVSAAGTPVMVALHYRNVGAEGLIVRANETSADDEKLPPSLKQAPLYPLEAVEIAPSGPAPVFVPWVPVPSQMFQLDKWVQLAPGQELRRLARLDTAFWEDGPRRGLTLGAGVYLVRAHLKHRAPDDAQLDAVKAFLASPRRTEAMAFWDLNVPLSLGEAYQLEKWGWRFWRGEVQTRAFVLERT
ncbi:MAG: hypothetical protein U0228_35475 [Myxococcaceae bacterium]